MAFQIHVIHNDETFYVCQDGNSLSCKEKEAGTWENGEATRLQRKWKKWETTSKVKLIYANPECDYCAQPGCPHCSDLFFAQV